MRAVISQNCEFNCMMAILKGEKAQLLCLLSLLSFPDLTGLQKFFVLQVSKSDVKLRQQNC